MLESGLIYPNQYMVCADPVAEVWPGAVEIKFCSLHVYCSPVLDVTRAEEGPVEVLVLGYIIDPENPARRNQQVVDDLARQCATAKKLFENLQALSGRFVLLYSNASTQIAVGDACVSRRVYYANASRGPFLTSDPRLFQLAFQTDPKRSIEKERLMELPDFERSERTWIGRESEDDRLQRLLPNEWLDIRASIAQKIPLDFSQIAPVSALAEYTCSILKGSLEAISQRYRVIQTLTAGWDSRMLLAAARDFVSSTPFFVIAGTHQTTSSPDVFVPLRLSAGLQLEFSVVRPGPVKTAFKRMCEEKQITPQPAKAPEIQYLWERFGDQNTIRVAGLAANLLKLPNGHTRSRPNQALTTEMLYSFTPYYRRSEFVQREIGKWVSEMWDYSEENGVQLWDLFYWDHRLGSWAALYAFEQDVAGVEEFWPHSNRNLLWSFLRTPPALRARPRALLYREIMRRMWPEVLNEAVNSGGIIQNLHFRLRNFARLRYLKKRVFLKRQTLQKSPNLRPRRGWGRENSEKI